MAQKLESLPQSFWRVHHKNSHTKFDPKKGFSARAPDTKPRSFYVNKRTIENHLQGVDRCFPVTALISVYDNENDAVKCAESQKKRGYHDVTISHIDTSALQRAYMLIAGAKMINLPAWETKDEKVYFFSTPTVREYLWVDEEKSTTGEWFALGTIPEFMITSRLLYHKPWVRNTWDGENEKGKP